MNKAHALALALALALTPIAAACTVTAPPAKQVMLQPAQDQTGITIDMITMMLTNKQCSAYVEAHTWQDLMLPPRRAKSDGSDGC